MPHSTLTESELQLFLCSIINFMSVIMMSKVVKSILHKFNYVCIYVVFCFIILILICFILCSNQVYDMALMMYVVNIVDFV